MTTLRLARFIAEMVGSIANHIKASEIFCGSRFPFAWSRLRDHPTPRLTN